MTKLLQTLPALLVSVALICLAVAMFLPKDQLPAWFREQIAEQQRARTIDLPATQAKAELSTADSPTTERAALREIVALGSAPDSLPLVSVIERRAQRTKPETSAELWNCLFTPLPANPTSLPRAVDVPLPEFPGRNAVWGGTGRDLQGRIWIGGCAEGEGRLSARLFCYDTQTGEMADIGDVVSALQEHGLLREGEQQAKIHSKIIQAGDGHLYFASMDEAGENPDGSELPLWGGHLWRLRLPERKWEHLHAAPEALIAVAGAGRYVYALGYFNHVLYQYDTETNKVQSTIVGAVNGHVSRNFLADLRGHVYVPRLIFNAESKQRRATLVEFDANLKELHETELPEYLAGNPADSHGITGVQPLADDSLAFVTHRGRLFHVSPDGDGAAEVKDLGWMHPQGEAVIESLFTYEGTSWLLAAARLPTNDYEWVAYDLKSSAATVRPLEVPVRYAGVRQGLLLYGSMTRDIEGAFYLVGTSVLSEPFGPIVWRLFPPK